MKKPNFYIEVEKSEKEVSSVAVMDGSKILMGKRRDTGKWTLPGGHHEKNEKKEQAVKRELHEEAGIKAKKVKHLGSEKVKTREGKQILVHAFKTKHNGQKPSVKNDPDKEVDKWHWIDSKKMPKHVINNLHSKKNVVLDKMGIKKAQRADHKYTHRYLKDGKWHYAYERKGKWYGFSPTGPQKIKPSNPEKLDDPKDWMQVAVKMTAEGRHKKLEHILSEKRRHAEQQQIRRSELLVIERDKSEKFFLVKAERGATVANHKYLRRYMRGGKWVYVYREPNRPARRISEEAVNNLKRLRELGDEQAKRIHGSMEDVHPEKLNLLRKLADKGDQSAHQHLKHHFGIDRETERVEEAIAPDLASNKDRIHHDLPEDKRRKAHEVMGDPVKSMFAHLDRHRNDEHYKKLSQAGVTHDSVMNAVKRHENPHDMMVELHKQMEKVDRAHRGLRSARTEVNNAGGYGNLVYDTAVNNLEVRGILPRGYKEVHSRKNRGRGEFKPHGYNEHEAKMEEKKRKEREKAEKEQRKLEREMGQLARVHGENVTAMASYFNKSLDMAQKKDLMKGMDSFFGKDFSWKNFLEYTTGGVNGVEITVSRGFMDSLQNIGRSGTRRGSISVSFEFKEKRTGEHITSASRGLYKGDDGSLKWSNGSFSRARNKYLKKYPGMARGLYAGVEKFMKEVTKGYRGAAKNNSRIVIGTAAHDGWGDGYKGGLVWANHYFDFPTPDRANSWKRNWKNKVQVYGRALGWSNAKIENIKTKINSFKYPYEFTKMGINLTKEQALTAAGQRKLDFDMENVVAKKGYLDLGALISVDSAWGWDSPTNYFNKTTGRAGHLNKIREVYYGHAERPRRSRRRAA